MTLHDEIKELVNEYGERAVLAAAERMVESQKHECGWRPIETAPELTLVMVYVGKQVIMASKSQARTWFAGWGPMRNNPTHWMPIPDPPA